MTLLGTASRTHRFPIPRLEEGTPNVPTLPVLRAKSRQANTRRFSVDHRIPQYISARNVSGFATTLANTRESPTYHKAPSCQANSPVGRVTSGACTPNTPASVASSGSRGFGHTKILYQQRHMRLEDLETGIDRDSPRQNCRPMSRPGTTMNATLMRTNPILSEVSAALPQSRLLATNEADTETLLARAQLASRSRPSSRLVLKLRAEEQPIHKSKEIPRVTIDDINEVDAQFGGREKVDFYMPMELIRAVADRSTRSQSRTPVHPEMSKDLQGEEANEDTSSSDGLTVFCGPK
ncbi:hypothetical protein GMRT_15565 [Giardia muris]|uniref:Uncharacterized protein n=1 Tax=Giardia muris TaxID=5742 RepID=A0A4Z1T4C6_GIAMU|nr:hypothetical protein GMRT_15565 [Giardia muris]|eukprot:TNJ28843.1 hypothetical protein GMRT_15565 [Giardia muris]